MSADADGGTHEPRTDRGALIGSFLWLAAVTGALSLLTPCVFPMIPVTVTWFNQIAEGGRSRVIRNAILFAGGIVGTFTALGLGLALLVGASGLARLAANPWVNIAIGLSFVAFALNLMGAWELRLPFMSSRRFFRRNRLAITPQEFRLVLTARILAGS